MAENPTVESRLPNLSQLGYSIKSTSQSRLEEPSQNEDLDEKGFTMTQDLLAEVQKYGAHPL